jgi:hypothetical protein
MLETSGDLSRSAACTTTHATSTAFGSAIGWCASTKLGYSLAVWVHTVDASGLVMAERINTCSIGALARKVLDPALGGSTRDSACQHTRNQGRLVNGRESQSMWTHLYKQVTFSPRYSPFTDGWKSHARFYWKTYGSDLGALSAMSKRSHPVIFQGDT